MPYVVEEEFSSADTEMARRLLSLKRDPSHALVARVRGIAALSQQRAWQMPRWAWGVVAAAVLLAVLVAASPPLRAAIVSLQETIGNVYLTIADRSLIRETERGLRPMGGTENRSRYRAASGTASKAQHK